MSQMDVEALTGLALFDGLRRDALDALAVQLRPMRIRKNTNLMSLEQPGDAIYVIRDGTVRVQAEQEDGSLVILAFLTTGDVLGELSAVDSAGRSATVVAVEPCDLLWLDRRAFLDLVEQHPRLAVNLLRVMTRRLRLANEHIQALSTLDVPGRVARQLLAFAKEYGEPVGHGGIRIPLRLTQSDIGGLVGASRERVNHVLGALRRAGILETDNRLRITVLDVAALRRRAR